MKLYGLILTLVLVYCSPNDRKGYGTENGYLVIEDCIGVVSTKNVGEEDTIKIFNQDGTLWYKFFFYEEIVIGMPPGFSPLEMDEDNLSLTFKCKEITPKQYIVFVNDREIKHLPKSDNLFSFYPWEEFILSGEVSIDPVQNAIYSDAVINSQIIEGNTDYFNPIAINEEWLQLEWREYGSNRVRRGWVKWRDDKRVLIRLVFF